MCARSAGARAEEPAPTPPVLRAQRVPDHSIDVDGRGDDAAWRSVPHYDGFVQQRPLEGKPASEPTTVAIAYDDDALYVLVQAKDSRPKEISALLTRRDEASSSDWINLWLDTFDDGLNAYRFSVNPRGVKQDARVYEGGEQEDVNWDAVWQAATTVGAHGWTAEYRIPFSQLRYDPERTRWRVQVGRVVQRAAEQSYLSPEPQSTTRFVHYFAALSHLDHLPHPLRLELNPYLRGGATWNDGSRKWDGSAGGDGRVGIGPSLTLDFTINPDFGQVEADPSVTPSEKPSGKLAARNKQQEREHGTPAKLGGETKGTRGRVRPIFDRFSVRIPVFLFLVPSCFLRDGLFG